MQIQLKGRTALVCGSSQGIGKAIATQLALSGANIILLARNEEKLKTICAELDSQQGQTHQVHRLRTD